MISAPVGDEAAFEIVTVQSGARTLRSRDCGETFHPVVGPMAEARVLHVEGPQLVKRAAGSRDCFTIWDVGLGAAANAVAVLEAFRGFREGAGVALHSFDETVAPLIFALEHMQELAYLTPHEAMVRELIATGAAAHPVQWRLHLGDFRDLVRRPELPTPHAILYDPYSPATNPEMWTLEHFSRLCACLRNESPCLLTSYTRSTAVRVTLLLAGFFVGHGAAVGEKCETTMATNARELLPAPLGRDWLDRVRRSSASAPLRGNSRGPLAISVEDFGALQRHAQFTHLA